jgi:hypothetical protein
MGQSFYIVTIFFYGNKDGKLKIPYNRETGQVSGRPSA